MPAFEVDQEKSVLLDSVFFNLFGPQFQEAPSVPLIPDIEVGDPEAVARIRTITGEVHALADVVDGGTWEQGNLLRPVREARLYRSIGHISFNAYCDAELKMDVRTAITLTELATVFTKAQYTELRVSRARVGMLLLRATPEADTAADLANMRLRYGSGAGKLFMEATIREIEESIRGERAERGEKKAPAASMPDAVGVLADTLMAAVGGEAKFKLVLSPTLTDDGEPCVSVKLDEMPLSRVSGILGRMHDASLLRRN